MCYCMLGPHPSQAFSRTFPSRVQRERLFLVDVITDGAKGHLLCVYHQISGTEPLVA